MPVRLISLLLALALSVPATAFGTALHLCRVMGAVKSECCCAPHGQPPEQQLQIRADCCEIPSVGSAAPAAALLPELLAVPAVPAAPLDDFLPAAFRADAAFGFARGRARAPPKRVPRFLENCALLT